MNIDSLLRRQAVSDWRDRQLAQAVSVINAAAIRARASFDAHLGEAGLVDSLWDPTGFVAQRVDVLMQKHLGGTLDEFLGRAANELRVIDERFLTLADALARSGPSLVLPTSIDEPAASENSDKNAESPSAAPVGTTQPSLSFFESLITSVGNSQAILVTKDWAASTGKNFATAAESLEMLVQDRVGLYERLRRRAVDRIAASWMADSGTPTPLKAQLCILIEDVTSEARSFNL